MASLLERGLLTELITCTTNLCDAHRHHSPLATTSPPSAGTSGLRSCADPPPLAIACRRPPNCQEPNGPDLDERPLFWYVTEPGDFADKIICSSPLAAAHPLTVLSWPRRSTPVCSGVPAGWPQAAMLVLSLISRNSPEQL